jgi:hypothetical protein
MASLPIADDRFDMGRVVSRSFGVISRNPALFFGLALLLSALPTLVLQFFVNSLSQTYPAGGSVLVQVKNVLAGVTGFILTAALSYATVSDLNDERPSFGRALGIGLRNAFPLFLLALLSMLGIAGATLLLIVPGIIVGIMWCVATPVMVTEQLGVRASLGRSRELTKGWRWQIFGLLLVAYILVLAPVLITPLLAGAFDNPAAMAQTEFGTSTIIEALIGAVASTILVAITASIYVELRTIKEGTSSQSLASIFA